MRRAPKVAAGTVSAMSTKRDDLDHHRSNYVCDGTPQATHDSADVSVPRAVLVEQVMRMTGEDFLILPFLTAQSNSVELWAATGRLLNCYEAPFPLSSPLAAWLGLDVQMSRTWREDTITVDGSLWGELDLMRRLATMSDTNQSDTEQSDTDKTDMDTTDCCPYRELERHRTEQRID